MRDIASNIGAALALAPAVQASATAGASLDTNNFEAIAIVVTTGAIVGAGDFGVKLQESSTDQSGDFTDVAASQVDTNAPATLAENAAYKLGYRGFKRYVRLALTKAGGTSIALGAVAIKGNAASRPVA